MAVGTKPPAWFWLVALLLVAWNGMGVYACVDQIRHGASSAMWVQDAYHQALYQSLPPWYNYIYMVGTFGGLLGALALLLREKRARILFWISLIAVIVQFGYAFAKTDIIAHEGAAKVVPFPIIIVLIALFSIWFVGFATRKGWIGR